MAKDKGNIETRRAIILLSDGDDNQSRVSREEAVEMAQKAEVIIYTISTNTSGMKLQRRQGARTLRRRDRRPRLLPVQDSGRVRRFLADSGRAAQPVRHLLQAGRLRSPTASITRLRFSPITRSTKCAPAKVITRQCSEAAGESQTSVSGVTDKPQELAREFRVCLGEDSVAFFPHRRCARAARNKTLSYISHRVQARPFE